MATQRSDTFHIFISHKHDDHDTAAHIANVLKRLDDQIQCFVSGSHLVAGTDWNAAIRAQLLKSHLLILLFTEPSKNWDWCLYEAGLFNRLGDENSVVCLCRPGGESPRPLQNLQGVPAEKTAVSRFLFQLCTRTWEVSHRWRQGPIGPRMTELQTDAFAAELLQKFPLSSRSGAGLPLAPYTHHPCHRVVLDLRHLHDAQAVRAGIPLDARVVEGQGATSTFTMSLFNLTSGLRSRTWGDLVQASGVAGGQWLTDLNERFAAALREELFSPSKTTPMPLMDSFTGQRRRSYRPVLYEILREPKPGTDTGHSPDPDDLRPLQVTLILDPVADSA